MAGIGKSVLAVRAASENADAFPDGQFHVCFRDATGRARDLPDVLDELLSGLGEPPAPRAGLEDRLRLLRRRLAEGRRLAVLDDVGADVPVDALVSGCGCNQLLITGRPRFADLPGVRVLALGALPQSEAVAVLTGIAGRTTADAGDRAALERLVQFCDLHPGALRALAAQLTAKPHWTPARLADRLTDPRRNMLDLLRVGGLDVGESLRRHYAELADPLRRALRRLAMLRARGISVWSAAAALEQSPNDAEDLLEQLVDAHMLTVIGRDDDGSFVFGLSGLLLQVLTDEAERTEPEGVRTAVVGRVLAAWEALDGTGQETREPPGCMAARGIESAGARFGTRLVALTRPLPAGPFATSAEFCRAYVRELRAAVGRPECIAEI